MSVLHIESPNGEFLDTLQNSMIKPYAIHCPGDQRSNDETDIYETYGVSLDVSDASWNEVDVLIQESIDFIELHKVTLMKIAEGDADYSAVLDIPYNCKEAFCQSTNLPLRLVQLCSATSVAITLSLYPPSEE